MPRPLLIFCRHLAPMDGPVLRDAGFATDNDRIVSVGSQADLNRLYPDSPILDLGESLILPGLVNTHTHLELSHLKPPTPAPPDLVPWLIDLIGKTSSQPNPEKVAASSARAGASASLSFGVTCVGDITRLPHATRPALRSGPLRVVSFGEVAAMGPRRTLLDERISRALDPSHNTQHLHIGVSPHAPYSIEPDGYRRCLHEARQRDLPLATHLAESAYEAEFLSHHTGPFSALWQSLGGLDDQTPTFAGGPIRLANSLGLLNYPKAILAHVNHCDDQELALLSAGQASVIYCPRTHAYFKHPPHRWLDMLAAGVNVAIATDSLASSPDLNPLGELRHLHASHPEVEPLRLFRMITTRAAHALGMTDHLGSLSPGKLADFAVFPSSSESENPLLDLLTTPANPLQVWIAGARAM